MIITHYMSRRKTTLSKKFNEPIKPENSTNSCLLTTQTKMVLSDPPIQYRTIQKVPFRQKNFTSQAAPVLRYFQFFKLILGAVTVFPIRCILAIFTLLITAVVAKLAHYLRPEDELKYCIFASTNLSKGGWTVVVVNRLVRLFLFCLGLTSIEFKGKVPVDYDQDTPWLKYSVVAAPHSGTFDWAMVVARATRVLSPTIKIEAFKPAKHFISLTAPIVIDRASADSRKQAVKDTSLRIIEGTSHGWFPIICFPEGTNGNRKQFLRFKAGPFIPGKPLIPAIIRYPQDDVNEDNDLMTWPHFGRSVLKTILLCMCRFQTTIVYEFLDPYFPNVEEQKNPNLYAENVRQYMSKEAKLPTSDWTFEDCKLMRFCQKHKFQPEIGGIQFSKIFDNIKFGEKMAKNLLEFYIQTLKKYIYDIDVEKHKKAKKDKNLTYKLMDEKHKKIRGLLPVIKKEILMAEVSNFEFDEHCNLVMKNVEFFGKFLPNYCSFEQLCVVFVQYLKENSGKN